MSEPKKDTSNQKKNLKRTILVKFDEIRQNMSKYNNMPHREKSSIIGI
jgi:hypothetical protein